MEQVVSFLFKYRPSLFEKSQFGFGASVSGLWIILIVLLVAALIYFLYVRVNVRLPLPWRVALLSIRALLIALILLVLMRPVIVAPSVVPGSSYVAVLMDDSASMKLRDEGDTTRLEALRQAMSPASRFYAELADKFKIRAYKFSSSAERISDSQELTGEGQRTDLAAALEHATRDMAGLPVSGIVVMSDGASNTEDAAKLESVIASLRSRGMPVFAVGIGRERIEGDIEIVRATAPRRALAGSPISAEALIRAGGHDRKTIRIDIAEDDRPLRSQDVPAPADSTSVARVTFTPSTPGIHRYRLTAVNSDDPVAENNSQEVVIEIEDAHPKILYIEGEPRWEYGKMREAVAEEKNVTLVSLLRSADGKYYRQGIENAEDLAAGFPKSEEELFKYDALIIGSVEATFFSFDQLRAIEQFVLRRGGALIALGGAKSFTAGGYQNTPFADLLPIYLGSQPPPPSDTQTFKPYPSDRGRDHPAARLAEQTDASLKAWEQMPAITLPETASGIKPGATVILEARSVSDKNRSVPLLIEQRYGRGRTLALMASDTWRWRMMLEFKNKSFDTFWKNLLRYLVESTRKKIEASTPRTFYGRSEQVNLRVEVADEKYLAVSDAQVTARIIAPSGKSAEVQLRPVVEGGFEGYGGQFVPDEEGFYKIEVAAQRSKSSSVAQLGSTQTNFLVGQMNHEARNAALNRQLLSRAAVDTGGKYYTLKDTANLVEDLTHTENAASQRVAYDLWDMPINFLLAIALASAEWLIRKRKGLA